MKTTKNILYYTTLVGLFLIPFIAFFVPNGMYFPFISGKGFVFRILIEIIFAAYVFLAAMAPEFRPKNSWITKTILIFAGAILIADLFGANVFKSLWSNYERMEGFVLIVHLLMYYFVASGILKTTERWKQLFNVSIFASVLMSFYGVLQLLGKIAVDQGGVRLDGTFGNATYLAIYLVFHIFFCLYFLSDFGIATWKKWTYGAIAVFETVILYFTATRGAILGLIGGLVVAGVCILWKERENKYVRKLGIGAIIAIVLLIGGFIALRKTSFVQNSPVLSRFESLGWTEFQSEGRYYVWPMAIKGFIQSPKTVLIGWGQENFNFVFNKYYDPRMYGQEEWFDRAHDIVLDWLIAGGLIGFLAYSSMYVALLYMLWRKQSPLKLLEKSLFTGLIAAYVFNNIFVFDNLVSYILFFSLLAYVHAVSTTHEHHPSVGAFHTKTFSDETVLYVIAPIIFVVTLGAIYFVNVPAILENTTLIAAISPQQGGAEANLALFKQAFSYNSFGQSEAVEQLVQIAAQVEAATEVPDNQKQDFYNFSKQEILAKVASTPTDARYLVFAGNFFNNFNQYDLAITYLKQALVQSPEKISIFFELGSSYIGKGDYQTAFNYFQQAYNLNTNSAESEIILAVGAIYSKNAAVLQQITAKVGEDALISDDRVLKAYADIGNYTMVVNILSARIAKNPSDMQSQLSLASAYATMGQKQKAIDLINQMIKEDPSFAAQGAAYIKQVQGM